MIAFLILKIFLNRIVGKIDFGVVNYIREMVALAGTFITT